MGVKSTVGGMMAPRLTGMAPGLTTRFVRDAMHHAVSGVGPLTGAAEGAEKQLKEQRGDVDRAVHEVIEFHVRLAGAGGFVTNLGGVVSAAVTIPVNITELALVQCRMIAGIAHLRGYDLADPRVRNAILAIMMGEDSVENLIKQRKLPARPMALATATEIDPAMDRVIANEVAADLIKRVAGKRTAIVVARRVPVVGGMVGAGADGYATWQLGRYADRELRPLIRR